MKNLKKILALAIAFVMCFTMFAGALVFSDVPAGGDYSAAITLLSDLGVIAGKPDGSFGINDAISRADAACLIARLMTGEQNPPKYNNAPVFTDVVPGSYYESSVGYCAALGITSGTGNGQFSPSKTITDGEFVAMLTRALGYDTPEHPLQWPMGNIVVAQQKGLLKNVNIEYTSDALRGEDAQMLANALFADYDRWAAQENLYQRADDRMSPTIAEIVFNLGRMAYNADYQTSSNNVKAGYNRAVDFFGNEAKKVYNDGKTDYEVDFDCQAHTWVIAGVDAREKENTYVAFAISDDDNKVVDPLGKEIRSSGDNWAYQTFTYTGDITPFIGYQVELWGEMDHPGKTLEVAAIRTIEGQKSYDYNASMDGGNDDVTVDDTKLKLKDAETGYANLQINTKNNWQTSEDLATGKYKNNRDVEAVYNLWKGHEKKDRQHVNGDELLRIKDGDQFKLFDWDNDGDLDFVVKNTAKYAIVEDVTAKRVVVASIDEEGKGIGFEADKTADNTSVSLKLGESDLVVNADGVEEGDIVEITVDSRVYTKADDEVVTITLSKVEPDAHKLTRVSTKGTLAPFFDGEEFFVANGGFWDLTEAKDPEDYKYEEEDIKRDFDLFLDRNGFIVYSRYSNGDSAKYMLIMETQDGGGRISAHHLPTIKALLENDKVETFDTIEKLKIYEPNGTDQVTDCYDSSNFKFTQKNIVGRVYKYYTNSKGEITKLVEAFDDTTVTDTGRNRTAILDDYSFNEKSISMLDTVGTNGRYNFEKAKAVFVVKTPSDDTGVATYIRKQPVAGGDDYLYVDRADVIAVDPDDIPNIAAKADPGSGVNAEVLTAATLRAAKDATRAVNTRYQDDADFDSYNTWQYTTPNGADKAAYIGYTNDNRDVSAALIGVDDFDGFGRNSVKLGILKRVDSDASEKDDEYVYTFHLAVDGKEIAEYKSDSVESLDDVMSRYSNGNTLAMSSKKDIDAILDTRGLAYVEVRFEGDLVDEIVVMDTADGGHLYNGEYYSVTRAVVGPNKINNV
ncbi:MAG: S-layer homology domain-containing protein, partial [Clostridiaceae bacterium]|nr:S-layer homology domain-containing protein [Clostridiaceae bacterium]